MTDVKDAPSALPDDALPILALRNTVLFPGLVTPLTVGRPGSVAALDQAVRGDSRIGVLAQRDATVLEPGPEHLQRVGTAAEVQRMLTTPDGQRVVLVRGIGRFRVVEFLPASILAARVEKLEDVVPKTNEFEARIVRLRQDALKAIALLPQEMPELAAGVSSIEDPSQLVDLIASSIGLGATVLQELLETLDVEARARRVAEKLAHQIEVLSLSQKIGSETKEAIDKSQREFILRQQLRTIQKELGEEDARATEISELKRRIEQATMPAEVEKGALAELSGLERMPEGAAESAVVRNHLEWLIAMPWSKESDERIDLAAARAVLDADHRGLEKVKQRIVEFLAVRKLNPKGRSPILCFVGPPGVGKTSLGRSIARATHREFVRQSLGGVHDESEIRGHRRTYVGAMPGRIVQGIRKAGTRNPVFMLDEIDKLSASLQGDPSAALLEVLDPEQNATFEDHYLDVPFDLSGVLFVTTANLLDPIPAPLRDRMEVIELAGYTDEEKVSIAEGHLLPREIEANGLRPGDVRIDAASLRAVIRGYTREAGVRQLERELGAICRKIATRFAEGDTTPVSVVPTMLPVLLGHPHFFDEIALRTSLAGVATGLAWTPRGGDILFIEATRMPGSGRLILTGQLGEVMKESAQAALSLVKSRARDLGIDPAVFEKSDLHVHLPAGAIPKDGPSAGITLFVALVSLLTGRRVRRDVALTGEISLRGLVLPVGGIKEKALAAQRAGITRVVLPALNRKDLEDLPAETRAALRLVTIESVDEALTQALEEEAIAVESGS